MPHVCLVVGDRSGAGHGARLVEALKRLDPSLTFAALGGSCLQAVGVELLDDLTQAAAIGPFDAVRHLRRFAQARNRFAAHLQARRTDAVILIDFGDFNLPVIAPIAKRAGCRVLYYVSPQLWAWGRVRLRWVRRYVDRMLVLFQFEEAFYREAGIPVTWVGHPLLDAVKPSAPREQLQHDLGLNPWRMTVGLLPGSREQEVKRHLPLLLSAAQRIAWHMPGVQFLLPKAPHVPARCFAPLEAHPGLAVRVCENRIGDCLAVMDSAIVTSGTATLEAALREVPMVVVYRTSLPTYLAARAVVRVPHIAMVNLIAGKTIVPECVQHRATSHRIARELVALLRSHERREAMREALRRVVEQLGLPGAVERTARAVLEELRNSGKSEVGGSKKEGI